MRIKTQKDNLEFNFDSLYLNAINNELDNEEKRPPQFRLSSSPFCPIKTLLEWHTFLNSPQTWTFKGDFYCGIGTSVHRALQDWIPTSNPGVVLGHWRCRHCCKHGYLEECIKCKKKCSLYKEAVVGPQYCPKCGRRMIYEEFHYLLPKVLIEC